MEIADRVKSLPIICALFITMGSTAALSATLSAPMPKNAKDYNYTNGEVGSNALGTTASEASDYNDLDLPLEAPTLKSSELVDKPSQASDSEKNGQVCLDSCAK